MKLSIATDLSSKQPVLIDFCSYHTIHNMMMMTHRTVTMKYTAAIAARIMMAVLVGMVEAGGEKGDKNI